MSAGKFTSAFYKTGTENGGFVMTCRVQPATLAATIDGVANAAPSGPTTAPGSATISQGRRTAGVNMRYVTFEFTGALPTDYSGDNVRIPVLDPDTFAAWTMGKTGTYRNVAVKVVGRQNETVK